MEAAKNKLQECAAENCTNAGTSVCSACRAVAYCNRDCQKKAWKAHKADCKLTQAGHQLTVQQRMAQMAASSDWANSGFKNIGDVAPDFWKAGLSPEKQLQWLCHCYRMRCDDDANYADNRHGFGYRYYMLGGNPEDPRELEVSTLCDGSELRENTAQGMTLDFLHFCLLCAGSGAVGQKWNWPGLLLFARHVLTVRFEKADAVAFYGGENVFSVMQQGKRSLRFTGETIYGHSIQTTKQSPQSNAAMAVALRWAHADPEVVPELACVGGIKIWDKLFQYFAAEDAAGRLQPREKDL